MFVKKIRMKNKTHLYLVESYRFSGKIKHRTVKALGILEELEKDNPNILEDLNNEYRNYKGKIEINLDNSELERTSNQNYGYFLLEAIFEKIGISEFLNKFKQTKKIRYNLDKVMKFHVFGRILMPDSKLGTFENKNYFYEDMSDININNMYRPLDLFAEFKEDLQLEMHSNIKNKYGRDCTLLFYDVTNYYFEIHQNDADIIDETTGELIEGFRKKGVNKKNVCQPQVAMGLIIDKNNIPVAYQLFRGNTSDTKTLIPMINQISTKYKLGKVIVVADKGINSENNLNFLVKENIENDVITGGNGYIVSQTVLGASEDFKAEAIKQLGYVENKEKKYKRKSIIRNRELYRKEATKKIKNTKITIQEKVVFFWSEDYARKRAYKREEQKSKIEYFIKNQDVLPKLEKGLKSYIKEIVLDKNGKEIKDTKVKYIFDEEKFKEDSKYDGYYAIITSEINLTDDEIIEKYRGLSEIENSFRILQSDLLARPVNVSLETRIEGHFLVCFISLVIMRILQNLTKHKVVDKKDKNKITDKIYTVENLAEALNSATLKPFQKNVLFFNKTNDVYINIEKIFNINNNFSSLRSEKFKKYKEEIFDYIKKSNFH